MQFEVLDRKMRVFETAHDHKVLPGMFMVARLDGRNFTHVTRDVHHFDAPFDERFRDHMVTATMHLMQCGFRTAYGYTQSDEISILFHRDDTTFDRKLRKYESVLAGEASAAITLQLGAHAAFDCRISQLPAEEYVVDYFRWRSEDADRNALNAHCYWMLRNQGQTVSQATGQLHRLSVADKPNCCSVPGSTSTIFRVGKSVVSASCGRAKNDLLSILEPAQQPWHNGVDSRLSTICP